MKEKVSVPFMLLGILFNVCLIAANLLETKVIQVPFPAVTTWRPPSRTAVTVPMIPRVYPTPWQPA